MKDRIVIKMNSEMLTWIVFEVLGRFSGDYIFIRTLAPSDEKPQKDFFTRSSILEIYRFLYFHTMKSSKNFKNS